MRKMLVALLSALMLLTMPMTISAKIIEPSFEITNIDDGKDYKVGETLEFSIKYTCAPPNGLMPWTEIATISSDEIGTIEKKVEGVWQTLSDVSLINEEIANPGEFTGNEFNFRITLNKPGTYQIDASFLEPIPRSDDYNTISNVSKTINVIADASIEDLSSHEVKYYGTLKDAVDNVKDGETITILRDIDDAVGIKVPSGKNFTIDFNNHKYTLNKPGAGSTNTQTQGFQLLKDSTITFKNGTLECSAENKDYTWEKTATEKGIAMMIQNYCNLTLDNMEIDGTNIAHNGTSVRYMISNNSGNVKLNNTTINAPTGDFAFDSCKYDDYTKPTVTVTGNSVITGKVEATGGDICFANGSKLNGQLRVGENKNGGSTGSVVTVSNGATISNPTGYAAVAFGANTLIIEGKIEGIVGTNGKAYNAGSTIRVKNGAELTCADDVAMYIPNGELYIEGGTITGANAVYFKSTLLSITGGTLIGNGNQAAYSFNNNGCNPTGDALVIDNCNYPSGITNVTVTGGNFKSANAKSIASYVGNGVAEADRKLGFVTGGNFEKDIDVDLIANGYKKALSTVDGYSISVEYVSDVTFDIVDTEKETIVSVQGEDGEEIGRHIHDSKVEDLVESIKNDSLKTIIDNAIAAEGSLNDENLEVIVFAKVEATKADLSASKDSDKTVTFKITPYAEVRLKESPFTSAGKVKISNDDLASNAKIKVTLPTCGIVPVEVVHVRENGSKEYFYATGDKTFTYNESDETITIEISDFSSIVINAKVTKPAPKKSSKTYKAPVTGIK